MIRHDGAAGMASARAPHGPRPGRLHPPHGKVVELQAFDGGAWRTCDSVRTTRGGRFTAHYRFRRTPPGRTIRLSARVRAKRGYPFRLGVSRTVRLRVG